jgi:hypothetical protein
MKYYIANVGCDDITETTIELSNQELEIILKFIRENNKTSGCCNPTINICKLEDKGSGKSLINCDIWY